MLKCLDGSALNQSVKYTAGSIVRDNAVILTVFPCDLWLPVGGSSFSLAAVSRRPIGVAAILQNGQLLSGCPVWNNSPSGTSHFASYCHLKQKLEFK